MYLIYNAWLHILSSILIAIVQILEHMMSPGWDVHEIPAILLMIINLWCLMLQRYNDLRIREVTARYRKLFAQRVQKMVSLIVATGDSGVEEELIQADIALVRELRSDTDIFLSDADITKLQHLAELASKLPHPVRYSGNLWNHPIDQVAACYKVDFSPKGKIVRKAESLLLWLGLRNYLPSEAKVVVTPNRIVEEAYYSLMGESSLENRRLKLAVLEMALTTGMVGKERITPLENASLVLSHFLHCRM